MSHPYARLLATAVIAAGFLGTVATAAGAVSIQYSNDFQGSIGAEWSVNRVDITPAGGRKFLGQFGNESVTLTVNNLRPHRAISIAFDLFIIGSWDGNYVSPGAGPDIWEVSADPGGTILRTTFNTHTFAAQYQAYPGSYPGGQHPSNTGAVEVGTLGYSCAGSCTNAVYHVEVELYHTVSSVELIFSGSNLEAISNESWGLDNVVISVESPSADFDDNAFVDQSDMLYLLACAGGPNLPIRSYPGCQMTDLDGDNDTDSTDFAIFQRCFSGPIIPADPHCID
jgi:hypothetical protein